jgi:hypothetical protein
MLTLKKNGSMSNEELLSTAAAAEYLSQHLPDKSPEQWALWLRNNRNHSRKAVYRVKAQQLGRMAVYTPDELVKFVEFEKQRQLGTIKLTGRAAEVMRAYGIGEAGGGTTGRTMNVTAINLQNDPVTGKPYIALVLNEPLMVYRLEVDQARSVSKELAELVAAAERISNEN